MFLNARFGLWTSRPASLNGGFPFGSSVWTYQLWLRFAARSSGAAVRLVSGL